MIASGGTTPSSQTAELWQPICGFDGRYEVSDQGNVRSWTKHKRGALLKQSPGPGGYLTVGLADPKGVSHTQRVHRLVLEAFAGPPEIDQVCRHLDGNCRNNRLSNLRWGTQSENIRDAVMHGTQNNARKTHCSRGHEYAGKNLRVGPKGRRECHTCQSIRRQAKEGYTGHPHPADRVACIHGHLFDEANTYVSKDGHRHCRACAAARARRYSAARRPAVEQG